MAHEVNSNTSDAVKFPTEILRPRQAVTGSGSRTLDHRQAIEFRHSAEGDLNHWIPSHSTLLESPILSRDFNPKSFAERRHVAEVLHFEFVPGMKLDHPIW